MELKKNMIQLRKADEEKLKQKINELLIVMKETNDNKTLPAARKEWAEKFEQYSIELQNMYIEVYKNNTTEKMLQYNRVFYPAIKEIDKYAISHEYGHLYMLGLLSGIYETNVKMSPYYNKQEIFQYNMASIVERAHVKDILKYLFEHENVQHKNLYNAVEISASQLNRAMNVLVDVQCVYKFVCGKYSYYNLTPNGRNYVNVTLGYKKKEVIDMDNNVFSRKKPRLGLMQEYKHISEEIEYEENSFKYGGIKYQYKC